MNIKNIAFLERQLGDIGFSDGLTELIRRVCFHPQGFSMGKDIVFGADHLQVRLSFVRTNDSGDYALVCYDVALDKDVPLPAGIVHGIDVGALDQEMAAIRWEEVTEAGEDTIISLEDEASWEQEAKIHRIVLALRGLEKDDAGRAVAGRLMQRHWPAPLTSVVPGLGPLLHNRPQFRQRFYMQPGQRLITIEEAYRFLLSKRFHEQRIKPKEGASKLQDPQPEATSGRRRDRSRKRPSERKAGGGNGYSSTD